MRTPTPVSRLSHEERTERLEEKQYWHDSLERKIVQMLPAAPGFRLVITLPDGSMITAPIIAWALVETLEDEDSPHSDVEPIYLDQGMPLIGSTHYRCDLVLAKGQTIEEVNRQVER